MMTFRQQHLGAVAFALAAVLAMACGDKESATGNETSAQTEGSDTGGDTEDSESSTGNGTEGTSPSGSETSMSDSDASSDPTNDPSDSDCGFICPTDAPGDGVSCDPGLQDCPDGEKCSPYVEEPGYCCVDSTHCVPDTGSKQYGDPCIREDDTDDCAKGFFCMTKTSGSTGEGVCLPLCDINDANTCAEYPNATCIAFNGGILPLCETKCDPLLQDCVGQGVGCYAAADGFVCATSGFDPGLGNDGDECYTIQSCQPGLICVGAGALEGCAAERCCTPVCDLSDPMAEANCMAAAATETCVSWFEMGMAPPEYQNVGVCAVPQ